MVVLVEQGLKGHCLDPETYSPLLPSSTLFLSNLCSLKFLKFTLVSRSSEHHRMTRRMVGKEERGDTEAREDAEDMVLRVLRSLCCLEVQRHLIPQLQRLCVTLCCSEWLPKVSLLLFFLLFFSLPSPFPL